MEEDICEQILVVEDEDVNTSSISSGIETLPQEEELISYVYKNYKDFDSFDIYSNGRHMNRLVQSGILTLDQVKRVTFYFDSMDEIRQAKQSLNEIPSKFNFCLKREVANRIQNAATLNALKSGSQLNARIVKLNAEQRRCRIQRKQGSLRAELSSTVVKHIVGIDARNLDTIDERYLCVLCGYIFRNPMQLSCGHRVCQSCAENWQENPVICPECSEDTLKKDILMDKGFKREMQMLKVACSFCNWAGQLKEYEDHLHQYHQNPRCKYCGEKFESASHLSIHQRINCQRTIMPCILQEYGCSNTVNHFEMEDHYLTEAHQFAIIQAIWHLFNNPPNIQDNNELETDAIESLSGINEMINIFAGGIQALTNDVQARSNEIPHLKNTMDTLLRNFVSLKSNVDQENIHLNELKHWQQLLQQDIILLHEKIANMIPISYDGTLVWRITNFWEKMSSAQSERQTSIHSPAFCSSENGYKMCLRLYLNGDGNARRTHMSLLFVLMRGENDGLLEWPFKYQVTFCLYDQTPAQQHIIDSFRPDIKSNSFQRPRSDMNIASGIPKFCPLKFIQQENTPYVRDDTIFIKVMVDFGEILGNKLQYAYSLNPGIPTRQHCEMIQMEADKQQ